ncbi:MAG: hypothetical protein ACRD1Z_08005 [Vicinamibacteria bacterium]
MDLEAIKNGIIETVKGRARKLLDGSAEARAFLEDRAKDIARLVVLLSKAGDEQEEEAVKREIAISRQAAENEIAGLALDAEAEARATFKEVLGTIFEFAEKALPAIIALL